MKEDKETPLNKCNYCDKVFIQKKRLTQHIKRVHHKTLAGESISKSTCVFCNKSFGLKESLQRHIDTIHIVSDDAFLCEKCAYTTKYKYNLKRHIKKFHSNINVPKKDFACSYCQRCYSYKHNLMTHLKKEHSNIYITRSQEINRQCPLCSFTSKSKTKNEINIHFSEEHKLTLKQEVHSFDSMDDFSMWKDDLEKRCMIFYVKQHSYHNRIYYGCHRSGYFKRSGTNRQLKIDGSCKINGHCPSEMKVKISDTGSVSVLYVPTHVGHTNKKRFKRLTSLEKQLFASQLLKKTPQEEKENLLKRLKNARTSCTPLKKYIANRGKNLNLNTELQEFDPVSVEAWVQELSSSKDTALLLYKPQGLTDEKLPELKEEDFLLIFMTEAQKALLKSSGNDTVCIDSTNTNTIGLDNYNFQLYTLHTIDECREGFPCAFMFTNKGDESTLHLFFRGIKEITGTIQTNVFMSDMEETVYSAWTSAMGPSNMRLFCTWHVLNAWRNNLNKIKNKEKRQEVYKQLKSLLYELDVDTFHKQISSVSEQLHNDHYTKEYSKYFTGQFIKNEKYRHWAYCYRTHAGINTNISLENFNKILKYCYLIGTTNEQRLDKTVCAILNLLRDKLYDDIIKTENVKIDAKLQDIRKKHKRALIITSENVVQDGEKWNVPSSKGTEMYVVKKVQECKTCRLQCSHCNSCFHQFVCTCRDNSVKNNMCEHIHAVARILPIEEPLQSEPDIIYFDQNFEEEDVILEDEIVSEISTDSSNKNNKKTEMKEKWDMLFEKITTSEEIEFVHKRLKDMLTAVNAMKVKVL